MEKYYKLWLAMLIAMVAVITASLSYLTFFTLWQQQHSERAYDLAVHIERGVAELGWDKQQVELILQGQSVLAYRVDVDGSPWLISKQQVDNGIEPHLIGDVRVTVVFASDYNLPFIALSSIILLTFFSSWGIYRLAIRQWISKFNYLNDLESGLLGLDFSSSSLSIRFKQQNALTQRIEQLLAVVADANKERGKVASDIRSKTFLDESSGLGNRSFFDNHLSNTLTDNDTSQGALLLLQLRDWDIIKTSLSSEQIEQLITQFVQAISFIQQYHGAVVARHSQQDFAALIPQIDQQQASKVASQLVQRCKMIAVPNEIDVHQFFHLGVSCFRHGQSCYQVLAEADMALRAAQLQGPNTWFMYEADDIGQNMVRGSVRWRTYLQHAIAKDSFLIYFQPVVYQDGETIHHHEVLARLKDDDGDLISASVFLPMAVKNGLTIKIDQLVINKVLRTLSYDSDALCSINLDTDSLLDKTFASWLTLTLLKRPELCRKIILEFPEYHIANHWPSLAEDLAALKKIGVRLSVDHVGQYVVDMDYIEQLDIDILKLHSSVVHNIDTRSENQLLVRTLQTTLARDDSVQIFAQGVENRNEWLALKGLNICGGQGTWFNEPLDALYSVKAE